MTSVFDHIFICDNEEFCKQCQHYKCKNTKESIEADFENILKDPSLCGKAYPKIAMLKWVIDGENVKKPTLLKRIANIVRG